MNRPDLLRGDSARGGRTTLRAKRLRSLGPPERLESRLLMAADTTAADPVALPSLADFLHLGGSSGTCTCPNCGRTVELTAAADSDLTTEARQVVDMLQPGGSLIEAGPDNAVRRIYIANDDHTDFIWTASESAYKQAFQDMLDYYLDLADSTANLPSNQQSRFNADGSYWMYVYEKNKSPAEFERLIDAVKSGHISVPMNALAIVTGGTPTEAVLRGMYYPGSIERRYGVDFDLAYAMENTTLPLGLASLWAGSGVEYSWRGICNCATSVNVVTRDHDIYWMTGLDGQRVLMKWNSYFDGQSLGGYAEARNLSAAMQLVETNPSYQSQWPYDINGIFGYGWDDFQTTTNQFVTFAQANTTANRQVIVSNEQDFFEAFKAQYGSSLPSESVSYGNEWEIQSAALVEQFARVRRSTEKLRSAEALASLALKVDPNFMQGRAAARELAFMDLGLFWEHDLGMAGPQTGQNGITERIAWQKRLAGEIEAYVDDLQADAITTLGAGIAKTGSNPRFFAFNPLSWTRTDVADFAYNGATNVHVVDVSTGQQVPSQIVTINGQQHLRVLASNIPSVGYKTYEVQPGAGTNFSAAATGTGSTFENSVYRVTVANNGAITSLIDKTQGNRQYAQQVGGRWLNDLGGTGGSSIVVESSGPVSMTLRATSTSPVAHTTRVTLYRDSRRVDIDNQITQNFTTEESWSYGFNLDDYTVHHEEVGAVLEVGLANQGGNYATKNARYDWQTFNHFVDMSEASAGITMSNSDLEFFRLGNMTSPQLDTTNPRISALAGGRVQNNLGLPNQGGDTLFTQRFALTTHGAYDPTSALRFSLEDNNPLVTGTIVGGTAYPQNNYSLVTIDDPDVLLWALKPADDQAGLIARVWNVGDVSANLHLSLATGINSAQKTTHVETPTGPASLVGGQLVDALPWQRMQTYLLSATATDTAPPVIPSSAITLSSTTGVHAAYTIPTGNGEQLRTVPVGAINRLSVRFSEPVVVSAGNLVLNGGQVPVYPQSSFSYNPTTFTATWTFSRQMVADQLTLSLSGVTDTAGNALDGEFDNATSLTDPLSGQGSGNGVAGGVFVFRFNTLAGDANRDNHVTGADFTIWSDHFRGPPGAPTSTFVNGDFNGDGFVTGADYTLWSDAFGMSAAPPVVLDPGDPPAAVADSLNEFVAAGPLLAPSNDRRRESDHAVVMAPRAKSESDEALPRAAHVDRALEEIADLLDIEQY